MNRIQTSAFAFRPEHCKHHPGVFFSTERSRGSSSSSTSRGAAVSGSLCLAPWEQTHRGWDGTGSSPRSPQPKPLCGSPGTSPSTPGHGPCGFGDWFDFGFHGGQTDQQTPTLLTAVTKQTKEISSEIKVKWFLSLLVKKKIADLGLLPLIWLTAHGTGVLSSEIREFISKTQLKSKPSTFTKHIQKDPTLLNPHTLDSRKKTLRNSVLSIRLRKAQEGRNFLVMNISQSNRDFSKFNILASYTHYVHFQVKMFWCI